MRLRGKERRSITARVRDIIGISCSLCLLFVALEMLFCFGSMYTCRAEIELVFLSTCSHAVGSLQAARLMDLIHHRVYESRKTVVDRGSLSPFSVIISKKETAHQRPIWFLHCW